MSARRALAGSLECSLAFAPAGNTTITAGIAPIWIDNRSEQIEDLQLCCSFTTTSTAAIPQLHGVGVWMVYCQQAEFLANAAANTPVFTVNNFSQADIWPFYTANPTLSNNTAAYANTSLQSFVNRFARLAFAISLPTQSNFQLPTIKIPASMREGYLIIGIAPFIQGYVQATTDGTAICHVGYAGVMYEP